MKTLKSFIAENAEPVRVYATYKKQNQDNTNHFLNLANKHKGQDFNHISNQLHTAVFPSLEHAKAFRNDMVRHALVTKRHPTEDKFIYV